jgi:hypothetical protein
LRAIETSFANRWHTNAADSDAERLIGGKLLRWLLIQGQALM